MPDIPIDEAGYKASEIAYKRLQQELEKRKAGLDRVAIRLKQGLSAKRTHLAQDKGLFTDSRDLVDYSTRATYCKLVIDVFGAAAPNKHEVTGADGEDLTINLTWPTNGNGKDADN